MLSFEQKGRVVLLEDFNARVGKSVDVDDVIGMFGEDTCNGNVNRLISLFNEVELVICNGKHLVSEPEWTRVRPSLNQNSVIDYGIADSQLMRESGVVQVDRTDIGASDNYLVWMELGRTSKHSRKGKCVIRKWQLDRLGDDGIKLKALQAEVSRFSESIQSKVASGMVGSGLVMNVLADWEVTKAVVGEKMIVCGSAARWWDAEVNAKIEHRRDVYRKIAGGQDELWEEYYKLRREVNN